MKRCWQRIDLVSTPRRTQTVSVPLHLSFQCRRGFSATLPALSSDVQDAPTSSRVWRWHGQKSLISVRGEVLGGEEETHELQLTGKLNGENTKIYGKYLSAVDNSEGVPLPLEVHQAVLRACTLPAHVIRAYAARTLAKERAMYHEFTHPHESRFRKITQNIVNAGFIPSTEDYHFIMSQLAAAGRHNAIRKYMRHMEEFGLVLGERAFQFLLQATANRVNFLRPMKNRASFRTSTLQRPRVFSMASDATVAIIREMAKRGIPPSPRTLDPVFRILSEEPELWKTEKLLRLCYGIDLNYLDSPPINHVPPSSGTSPKSLPEALSTNALNSVVQTFGQRGLISKMVYIFESLTNPLPMPAKPDNAFDDDDDDFIPIQQSWKPPSPQPNTTSFNFLIKYCVEHRYPWLAKHYATQMMHAERTGMDRLMRELNEKPLSEVLAPSAAVSEGTLLPLLHIANRTHNTELLRWIVWACGESIGRKFRSLAFHNHAWKKFKSQNEAPTSAAPDSPEFSESSPNVDTPNLPESLPSPTASPSPSPSPGKPFHIKMHIRILKHDLARLFPVKWHAERRLHNVITRVKARLWRRILAGKDIYVRSQDARVKVDPEVWKHKLNFKERRMEALRRPRTRVYLGNNFDPVIAKRGRRWP